MDNIDQELVDSSTRLVLRVFIGFFAIALIAILVEDKFFPARERHSSWEEIVYPATENYLRRIGK